MGVTCEHIYSLPGEPGHLMILVWEGMDQAEAGARMADMLQSSRSDHERYLAAHVIPVNHGTDPAAGPPPEVDKVATIEV
jgi:hypothetical protein